MSRTIDLFIDSPLGLEELAHCLAALTRATSRTRQDGCAELSAGPVSAELAEHRYVDDGGLCLSRYRYALSARFAAAEGGAGDCPEVAFVRRTGDLVRQRMGVPALVVMDLEMRDAAPPAARPPAPPAAGDGQCQQ
ncbi:MAG: hypothetical protein ACRDY0_01375 [Acidimicrobiales bacterium]